MEMKIFISGVGVGLAKTGLGLNVVSGCYISVRYTPSDKPSVYGIANAFTLVLNQVHCYTAMWKPIGFLWRLIKKIVLQI